MASEPVMEPEPDMLPEPAMEPEPAALPAMLPEPEPEASPEPALWLMPALAEPAEELLWLTLLGALVEEGFEEVPLSPPQQYGCAEYGEKIVGIELADETYGQLTIVEVKQHAFKMRFQYLTLEVTQAS